MAHEVGDLLIRKRPIINEGFRIEPKEQSCRSPFQTKEKKRKKKNHRKGKQKDNNDLKAENNNPMQVKIRVSLDIRPQSQRDSEKKRFRKYI